MPFLKKFISRFLNSDWSLTALILVLFLLTNRYIYGWDDQHLEIPLLKHLIDPALYQGDYYVESLKVNFTSFLYPLLARFISVDGIPFVYLTLYLLSRYFFFFWILRLWSFLSSGDKIAAFFCTLTVFLIGRTEELIYRTFSHQEFALAFIFAAIYFFYRERFLVAACILGFAANFHALYALFPMLYMCFYLLFFHKEKKWWHLFKSAVGFLLTALPFFAWTIQRVVQTRLHVDPGLYENWMELYVLSCPQTFIFGDTPVKEALSSLPVFLTGLHNYLFIFVLFMFHWFVNPQFRQDRKILAFALVSLILLIVTWVFSYVIPSHFVLDLNLVRNEQYVRILLGGYTVLFLWQHRQSLLWKVFLLSILLAVSGGKDVSDIAVTLLAGMVMVVTDHNRKTPFKCLLGSILLILAVVFIFIMRNDLSYAGTKLFRHLVLCGLWVILLAAYFFYHKNPVWSCRIKRFFFFAPFVVMFFFFCYNHILYLRISEKGGGFWQLQRNWEDMQFYVKEHTPKDALIMAPNDMEMGGFRIHSNRRLLTDYRDCGIIGFDMQAAVEWRRRMRDIDAFKVFIKEPVIEAIRNGIVKYHADYIVFMKYAAPSDSILLSKIYENEVFSLFQVNRNN